MYGASILIRWLMCGGSRLRRDRFGHIFSRNTKTQVIWVAYGVIATAGLRYPISTGIKCGVPISSGLEEMMS